MECFGRTDFLIKKTLQTWTGTGNEEHFTLFHCTSLDAGVFLSAQLSFHGKPASFSFRYHPKHGGSLSHARGVAQEIQPIFRCSNGAEDVHPYQSEDDTHRYSLDVQKKGENYLTIFASQQSMITCFFLSFLIPPLCFSKVIPGSLAKILAPPGGCGMYKHPNKRWEICQATAGSSATSRVRNVWKRQLQLMWFCSLQVCFWISMCDISFVSGFVSPNSFQVDFRSCLPMIINIPQHAVLSRTWQSLRFGMTCNRKFVQPLSYWVVKVGGKLSLFCDFFGTSPRRDSRLVPFIKISKGRCKSPGSSTKKDSCHSFFNFFKSTIDSIFI